MKNEQMAALENACVEIAGRAQAEIRDVLKRIYGGTADSPKVELRVRVDDGVPWWRRVFRWGARS